MHLKLSSPRERLPSLPDDAEWMVGTIEHQVTVGSETSEVTVASTADHYKNSLHQPLIRGIESPRLWPRKFASPGSKYPLVAVISGTLVAGIAIGFVVACVLLPMLFSKQSTDIAQSHPDLYQLVPPPTGVPDAYYAATPFNNENLIPNLPTIRAVAGKPQTFDACGFIVQSTDDVWNRRGNVDEAIEKYFHADYVDAGSWGTRIIGKEALKRAVWSEMRAFPDIQIHITDCLCSGNDVDGYKCAMPDVLTGTNTGPSSWGPATGKRAKWTGLVESLVKQNPKTGQWQYYAEWGVHDEWALIQQLGLDFSRVPHPKVNSEPLHDGKALVSFSENGFTIGDVDLMQQKLHDSEKF
mmetsp:Transcript_47015/g.73413  ORF Transcript_47015/g.73413 Transcript_47015/m.73413 type:complete len:354 (-) Transcript_47015:107-1168(-)|eukprot:CAMPEP_0169101152 /NCGR_PEP_ID=MMETSP1015-20121227/21479_1 /TAXON_ID=342587 /ORGANISM="Karlodinium micrum, Strain CCMP2283" /LENGTH=353 /DNA_ID=CAMNT_0009162163 /DNA_START=40 /DNA_END=1101 /DNA_ORIENTATION=-